MKNPTLANLIDLLDAAQRVALILHVSPDGDTCGSALALRRALLLKGKTVYTACDHPVPLIYEDLDGAASIVTPDALAGVTFDLSVAVDVADRLRLGRSVAVFDAGRYTAQIDHHQTNPGYADVNYVRSPLSATSVLMLEVIDALGVPLDMEMAKCLFVAVATDTGNFKQQNTDSAALRLAARCVDTGLDPSAISRRVFDLRPLGQVKLLARALDSLITYADGQIAIMRLTRDDFVETGALPEHTEGIVNYGINTQGVVMTCLMSQPGQKVKGSFRSIPPYDVSQVAASLGGGGHALAAGCLLEPPLEEASARILAAMRAELERKK